MNQSMKKNKKVLIFLGVSCLLTNLFASNPNEYFSNTPTKSKEKEFKLTKENLKKNILVGDFVRITGDTEENFNKYIDIALKDKEFLEANNAFYNEKKPFQVPEGYEAAKNVPKELPDWRKALEKLHISATKNNNVLAAYQGLTMINNFFGVMSPTKKSAPTVIENIMDKYMIDFTDKLKGKGYCYGYMYQQKYYLNYANDIEKAIYVGEIGKEICKEQLKNKKIEPWQEFQIRKDFVKAKTFQNIRYEKAKQGITNE